MEEVGKLAKRHTQYGVRPDHYTSVGTALLWTLEQGLGEAWNETLKSSWIEIYTALSGAMIEAQEEQRA